MSNDIELSDREKEVVAGTVWKHKNGLIFIVIAVANLENNLNPTFYPPTVFIKE